VSLVTLAAPLSAQDSPEIDPDTFAEPQTVTDPEAASPNRGERYIVGQVYDRGTGAGVPLAPLSLFKLGSAADTLGTPWGGIWAGDDGSFQLFVDPGHWRINVSYFGYEPEVVGPLDTTRLDTLYVDIRLTESLEEVDVVEVVGTRLQNTTQSVLTEQRESMAIQDGISAEQISKSTDSNAADVAARMTGVTVLDGKYTYVRGLGERYSSTMVNGVTVASPEPNRRVVPLDMFASGLLDKITVQKSYTPDKPGEFAGGLVQVELRDFPGRRLWELGTSMGHTSSTTGYRWATYDGGGKDWLGFDDGTRELPQVVRDLAGDTRIKPSNFDQSQLEALGESFARNWNTRHTPADPNLGFSGAFGDKATLGGVKVGFLATGSYSTSFSSKEGGESTLRAETGSDGQTMASPKNDYTYERDTQDVLWGAQSNLTLGFTRATTVSLRSSYNRSAEDESLFYTGFLEDWDTDIQVQRFTYVERGTLLNTLELNHPLPLGATVTWRASLSDAERNEPDRHEYIYEYFNRPPTLQGYLLTTRDPNFTRFFGTTEDDETTTEGHLEIPLPSWNEGQKIALKGGYWHREKERFTENRRFHFNLPSWAGADRLRFFLPPDSLMTDEYIGGRTGDGYFVVEETTQDTDGYEGSLDIEASYVMAEIPVTSRLRVVGGVRWERARMAVDTRNQFAEPLSVDDNTARLDNQDALPAVNLVYALGSRTNLRAGVSRTLARPDLRELSPMQFVEFRSGAAIQGNPDLVRTEIENYDLRFETYPGPTELIALSGFYKRFTDPVVYTVQSSVSQPFKHPINANRGEIYGLELESRVRMSRFLRALRDVEVGLNWTVTESELDTSDLGGVGAERDRPMDGQSPFVVNLALHVDTPWSTGFSVLYHVFGERLRDLSVAEALPDIYEQPRHSVDVKFTLADGRWKLSLENLLDDEVEFTQGENVIRNWRTGRKVSVSYSIKG
jgi:hypothetical protein